MGRGQLRPRKDGAKSQMQQELAVMGSKSRTEGLLVFTLLAQ